MATDGTHNSHSLTVRGWIRAGALRACSPRTTATRPPRCGAPDAVYGTAVTSTAHSKRSVQTVTPLAGWLGLDVVDHYGEGE